MSCHLQKWVQYSFWLFEYILFEDSHFLIIQTALFIDLASELSGIEQEHQSKTMSCDKDKAKVL